MRDIKMKIKEKAKEIGFDLVGFSPAKIEDKYLQAFEDWLDEGHEADMSYMQKIKQRRDLTEILPGAKAVIVLATNYYYEQDPLKPEHGRVARYAYGRDYHKIIGKRLKKLREFLESEFPEEEHKAYVDTGPILERALAEQAGIGRAGKNACLITKDFGSWVFLSEIVTTLDLQPQAPSKTPFENRPFSLCGNCTKCIDACPTGAIIAPGVIDSRLCISYLTIENKGKIPPELAAKIRQAQTLYGCDICQQVCPHNEAKQKPHQHKDLQEPRIAGDQLPLKELQKICTSDANFLSRFAGSPVMRAKKEGMRRNAKTLTVPKT